MSQNMPKPQNSWFIFSNKKGQNWKFSKYVPNTRISPGFWLIERKKITFLTYVHRELWDHTSNTNSFLPRPRFWFVCEHHYGEEVKASQNLLCLWQTLPPLALYPRTLHLTLVFYTCGLISQTMLNQVFDKDYTGNNSFKIAILNFLRWQPLLYPLINLSLPPQ